MRDEGRPTVGTPTGSGQEITVARWGTYGVPVLLFPTAGGDAEEVERHKMVAHLAPLMDAGRAKVYSCDSVAGKAMAERAGTPGPVAGPIQRFPPGRRRGNHPRDPLRLRRAATGRRRPGRRSGPSTRSRSSAATPHLVSSAVCMSGTYAIEKFIGGRFTDDLYFSSPLHFLPGLEGPGARHSPPAHGRARLGQRGAGRTSGESWAVAKVLGRQGDPQQGRRLGHGLRPRLADVVGDAPALPRRPAALTPPHRVCTSCRHLGGATWV